MNVDDEKRTETQSLSVKNGPNSIVLSSASSPTHPGVFLQGLQLYHRSTIKWSKFDCSRSRDAAYRRLLTLAGLTKHSNPWRSCYRETGNPRSRFRAPHTIRQLRDGCSATSIGRCSNLVSARVPGLISLENLRADIFGPHVTRGVTVELRIPFLTRAASVGFNLSYLRRTRLGGSCERRRGGSVEDYWMPG